MSDFDAEFEKLAEQIAKDAQNADSLIDKVDAMKALQPYYALRRKQKVSGNPADGTMDALRNKIKAAENSDADHAQ